MKRCFVITARYIFLHNFNLEHFLFEHIFTSPFQRFFWSKKRIVISILTKITLIIIYFHNRAALIQTRVEFTSDSDNTISTSSKHEAKASSSNSSLCVVYHRSSMLLHHLLYWLPVYVIKLSSVVEGGVHYSCFDAWMMKLMNFLTVQNALFLLPPILNRFPPSIKHLGNQT